MKKISLLVKIMLIEFIFFILSILDIIFEINSYWNLILIPLFGIINIFISIYVIEKSSKENKKNFENLIDNFYK